mgnify:CR=1 FL=1
MKPFLNIILLTRKVKTLANSNESLTKHTAILQLSVNLMWAYFVYVIIVTWAYVMKSTSSTCLIGVSVVNICIFLENDWKFVLDIYYKVS